MTLLTASSAREHRSERRAILVGLTMDHPQAWIEKLSELRAKGRPCALVVVTGVKGSGPRESGARMIVAGGELVWGTIGGGNLERQAIEHASGLVRRGGALSESVAYPLGEKVGQCCGGE